MTSYKRTTLYLSDDRPLISYAQTHWGPVLDAFGIKRNATDDRFSRDLGCLRQEPILGRGGLPPANIIVGGKEGAWVGRFMLMPDDGWRRRDNIVGADILLGGGTFYSVQDPSVACTPTWNVRMTRPWDRDNWLERPLEGDRILERQRKQIPQWEPRPNDLTGALWLAEDDGVWPALVWVDPDGSVQFINLANYFDGDSLVFVEDGGNSVIIDCSDENSGRDIPDVTVTRGVSDERMLGDGKPRYWVQADGRFLPHFRDAGKRKLIRSRRFFTAWSDDGKHWHSMTLTPVSQIDGVGATEAVQARGVVVKKKTTPESAATTEQPATTAETQQS